MLGTHTPALYSIDAIQSGIEKFALRGKVAETVFCVSQMLRSGHANATFNYLSTKIIENNGLAWPNCSIAINKSYADWMTLHKNIPDAKKVAMSAEAMDILVRLTLQYCVAAKSREVVHASNYSLSLRPSDVDLSPYKSGLLPAGNTDFLIAQLRAALGAGDEKVVLFLVNVICVTCYRVKDRVLGLELWEVLSDKSCYPIDVNVDSTKIDATVEAIAGLRKMTLTSSRDLGQARLNTIFASLLITRIKTTVFTADGQDISVCGDIDAMVAKLSDPVNDRERTVSMPDYIFDRRTDRGGKQKDTKPSLLIAAEKNGRKDEVSKWDDVEINKSHGNAVLIAAGETQFSQHLKTLGEGLDKDAYTDLAWAYILKSEKALASPDQHSKVSAKNLEEYSWNNWIQTWLESDYARKMKWPETKKLVGKKRKSAEDNNTPIKSKTSKKARSSSASPKKVDDGASSDESESDSAKKKSAIVAASVQARKERKTHVNAMVDTFEQAYSEGIVLGHILTTDKIENTILKAPFAEVPNATTKSIRMCEDYRYQGPYDLSKTVDLEQVALEYNASIFMGARSTIAFMKDDKGMLWKVTPQIATVVDSTKWKLLDKKQRKKDGDIPVQVVDDWSTGAVSLNDITPSDWEKCPKVLMQALIHLILRWVVSPSCRDNHIGELFVSASHPDRKRISDDDKVYSLDLGGYRAPSDRKENNMETDEEDTWFGILMTRSLSPSHQKAMESAMKKHNEFVSRELAMLIGESSTKSVAVIRKIIFISQILIHVANGGL